MRHTRSKQIRKTLQFYERIIPGFPRTLTSSSSSTSSSVSTPLYHILLDGTFIVHSYKYHIPFIERIYKLLGLRWYHHDHHHEEEEDDGDERHGNHGANNHSRHNHNMTKKLIQFYVCQSTITELRTIRNTMRQQQQQKKLRKQLKKKKKKKKSDTNIDIPIHDNDDGNVNEDHQADNGEDENVKDIDDYLLQAIEFCESQQQNSDERMNVIILPSENVTNTKESLASSNRTDDLSQNETPTATKDSNHQSHNRTNHRSPPLSSASCDLWDYLRQYSSSSSNSSSTTSSGTTNHSKPPQSQHYMIATQDPTLLYYCRRHSHAPSSTTSRPRPRPPTPPRINQRCRYRFRFYDTTFQP